MNNFIQTLCEIISSSPTTVITLIVGLIFLISMIISIKKNQKMGKPLFIIGWLFIGVFAVFKYNNYLTNLLDNFINNFFMQIFFPNFATYIIIIALTNFIFLFSILRDRSKLSDKIINLVFFTIIIGLLLLTLEEVAENNINVYEKLDVYENETLIILIQSTTITFITWVIILISKLIIRKLIKKSDAKVKAKFENIEEDLANNQNIINNTVEKDMDPDSFIPETLAASPNISNTIENVVSTNNTVDIYEDTTKNTNIVTSAEPNTVEKDITNTNSQVNNPTETNNAVEKAAAEPILPAEEPVNENISITAPSIAPIPENIMVGKPQNEDNININNFGDLINEDKLAIFKMAPKNDVNNTNVQNNDTIEILKL